MTNRKKKKNRKEYYDKQKKRRKTEKNIMTNRKKKKQNIMTNRKKKKNRKKTFWQTEKSLIWPGFVLPLIAKDIDIDFKLESQLRT
jgi:hypothetical protein